MEVTLVPPPQVHPCPSTAAPRPCESQPPCTGKHPSVLLRVLMGSATCLFQCQLPIRAALLAHGWIIEKAPFKYLKRMTCADVWKVLLRGDINKKSSGLHMARDRPLLSTLKVLVALAPTLLCGLVCVCGGGALVQAVVKHTGLKLYWNP